jgi:uncharacterized surface protein with fasciclin (FAS1) repeats
MSLVQRRGFLLLSGVSAGLLAAPALRAQTGNIANGLQGDPRFREFMDLIVRGAFTSYLSEPGPVTMFAPVNEAFQSAPYLMMNNTMPLGGTSGPADPAQGRDTWGMIIANHVVMGQALRLAQLTNGLQLRTRADGMLAVANAGGNIEVRNVSSGPLRSFRSMGGTEVPPARVVGPELVATNGVIIPVNNFLWL